MTTEERIQIFTEACNKLNFVLTEEFFTWLKENGFFTAPASTKYHGSYEGGLFDHSMAVTRRLMELTMDNNIVWHRKESPFIIGMFHDLCKCDQYIKKEGSLTDIEGFTAHGDGLYHYEYNPNTLLKGHGTKSIMLLSQFIKLTEEEMLCIRYHMGAYGNEEDQKTEWAGFDAAIRKFPTVFWTHAADMLASKVDDI